MGNICRKRDKIVTLPKCHVEMVESHDPNRHMKERACYDILMRTNKDKPSPPRDPNQPYDSVKSEEVLVYINRYPGGAAFVSGSRKINETETMNDDALKVRRESKDIWMNRLMGHIVRSEAMKNNLEDDSERIRNSYQPKMSMDGKTQKRSINKLKPPKPETENNTDDERKSGDYGKDYEKFDKYYTKDIDEYVDYV